ncbi:MAG: nucleotidyltransferase family protein [Candidatus Diapherotrites archaeon]|uniref:Nucleotidyltransferase family protein n=1 Tax=Candidatus Iainarchaeum sp. TaxID=3101447 RepID=A0A938YY70_9ARCH|nr:nucleotidyltransferase family protein [Candidatus Diapherotrites archaeon]
MQVIIPAAGFATRLYPLTENQPKALLEVKGKPILEHIIAKLGQLPGIESIYIVTNEKFFKNFDEWLSGFKSKAPLKILNDGTTSNDDRLGQIGDIQFVIDSVGIDGDLLIIAGDNLFNFSLNPVFNFFTEKRAIVNALYDIADIEAAKELGVASINEEHLVTSFEEKPEHPKSTTVSLGIYLFPKQSVKEIKAFLGQGGKPDKIGYLMKWLTGKKELYGFAYKEKWFDIGWPAALERARKEFVP